MPNDPTDASVRWEHRLRLGREPQIMRVQNQIVLLSEDGRLARLDVATTPAGLSVLTDQPVVDGPCFVSPIFSDGSLIVRGLNELVCLESAR